MRALDEHYAEFGELNTIPLGIGVDSVYSNKAWVEAMGLKKLRLLADFWPHGEVARACGVFREEQGVSQRANIIVNEARQVILGKVYPTEELPDFDEILDLLRGQKFVIK